MRFSLLSVFVLAGVSLAQDLGVPTWWREFSTNRSLDERKGIAQRALDKLTPLRNADNGEYTGVGYWNSPASVIAAMANFDHFTSQGMYKDQVVASLNAAFAKYAHYDQFGYNDDAMWWATAAMYAYRAYGDTDLLNHAMDSWHNVVNFQVTQANADSGSIPGKNFPIAGSCENVSMVGGVFWRSNNDDSGMNTVTTSLFLALSAYLAQASNNDPQYVNAAVAAAGWLKAHQVASDGVMLDSLNGKDCTRSPDNWRFTYNSGKTIEGLSVLYKVTQDGQYKDWMTNLVNSAVKTKAWARDDGVITEGASPDSQNDGVVFKSVFIRGLNEALMNTDNHDLGTLIHSYIDVQFNALLELAASGDTYSSAWAGPAQGFTAWGQAAAVDVLVSAITANS